MGVEVFYFEGVMQRTRGGEVLKRKERSGACKAGNT